MNELAGFTIRPMADGDGPAVRAGFASLSKRSLRGRFFTPWVTDAVLDRLATLDPATELVLLAFERSTGRLAGGVRLTRHDDDPGVADVAITVGDAFQRCGLGRALLAAASNAAPAAGIRRFGGHVLTDNTAARRLVAGAGARFAFDEPGVLAFDLPVRPRGLPLHLRPAS
jgi:RimJ/RimL family protein N-acetyltransferase